MTWSHISIMRALGAQKWLPEPSGREVCHSVVTDGFLEGYQGLLIHVKLPFACDCRTRFLTNFVKLILCKKKSIVLENAHIIINP